MATPITWKNINNPANSAGAVNARSGALDSSRFAFEAMSKSFESAIKRQQGIRTDNRENTIDNNTQGFKDLMSQYKSPEEIEAARQEGVFGNYLEQKGGMIDRDVANQGAVDSRVTGLRQAETADYNYNQTQQTRADTPWVDKFTSRINSINTEGGIEGIGAGYDEVTQGIQARIDSGELSPAAGAKLKQTAYTRMNSLENDWDADVTRNQNAEDRARTEAERSRLKTIEDITGSAINGHRTGSAADEQNYLDVVQEYGAVLDKNGNLDLENSPPEAILKLQQDKAAGKFKSNSATDSMRAMEQRLRAAGASEVEIAQQREELNAGLANPMAQEERDELNRLTAANDEKYGIADNAWAQHAAFEGDRVQAANDMLDNLSGEGGPLENLSNGEKRDVAVRFAAGAIGDGIDLGRGKEPVPLGFVEMAIKGAGHTWTQSSLETSLKKVLESTGGTKQYDDYIAHKTNQDAIGSEILRASGKSGNLSARLRRLGSAQGLTTETTKTEERETETTEPVETVTQTFPKPTPAPEPVAQSELGRNIDAISRTSSNLSSATDPFFLDQVKSTASAVGDFIAPRGLSTDAAQTNMDYADWVSSSMDNMGGTSLSQSFRSLTPQQSDDVEAVESLLNSREGNRLFADNPEARQLFRVDQVAFTRMVKDGASMEEIAQALESKRQEQAYQPSPYQNRDVPVR